MKNFQCRQRHQNEEWFHYSTPESFRGKSYFPLTSPLPDFVFPLPHSSVGKRFPLSTRCRNKVPARIPKCTVLCEK
ncbi:hypothetical protein CEXT_449331 [Caerostris extrusa]|uniref:Uncharacterized protein n=1 Tax=Caerostris extrusa TaxID=172846 RepID=A0AAV4UXL8_CAEEX|nr:hypothetical protein CEXT_449331 [Caerostris extrusa]